MQTGSSGCWYGESRQPWSSSSAGLTIPIYDYRDAAADPLGRRTRLNYSSGVNAAFMEDYGYNTRNELKDADLFVGGTLDRALDYAYDPIGNRSSAVQADGTTATTSYYRDQLNRYFRAETAAAEYLVQGLRYDEDGNLIEYYIAADMNCDGVTNFSDQNAFVLLLTQGRAAYEARYPNCNWLNGDINGDGNVTMSGDLNPFVGLLQRCGLNGHGLTAQYQWDAENRLIEVGPAEGVTPEAGDLRVEFVYDHLGRRVQKRVTVWDPTLNGGQGGWSAVLEGAATHRYVWDGWRMLIEWIDTPDADVTRTYTWGLDLGGLNGAGGAGVSPANMAAAVLEAAGTIGGLLALHDDAGTPSNPADDHDYAYLCDGNGNVGQLVAWAAGYGGTSGHGWDTTPPTRARLAARYEYDPYGQTIGPDPDDDGDWLEHAGPYALDNPFRFSTKYWDDETGLGYWGYRYYSPGLGRWVSRDPIGREGGLHLYGYVDNQPTSETDAVGQQTRCPPGHYWHPDLGCVRLTDPVPPASDGSALPKPKNSCGVCGPNITQALTNLISDIDAKFLALKNSNPKAAGDLCGGYIDSAHWDSDLFTVPTLFVTPNCPKGGPPCAIDWTKTGGTPGKMGGMPVTVNGRCHASFDVNYVVFGRMIQHCGNVNTAMFWFDAYKNPWSPVAYIKSSDERYHAAHVWLVYGSSGGTINPPSPPSLRKCAPCDERWNGTIHWRVVGDNGARIGG